MTAQSFAAPRVVANVEPCVEALIERIGTDLRVGLPLGLGKPVELVNALYARAKADPAIRLTLLTALSLEKPQPAPGLEAAFLQPFLDRVFAGVPNSTTPATMRCGVVRELQAIS